VIEDCSCALGQTIPQQGHLWVTEEWICFHAKILRRKTLVKFSIGDIVSLTKANTAYVVANAIEIITKDQKKFFFTSFTHRDRTFAALEQQWLKRRPTDFKPPDETTKLPCSQDEPTSSVPSDQKVSAAEPTHRNNQAERTAPLNRAVPTVEEQSKEQEERRERETEREESERAKAREMEKERRDRDRDREREKEKQREMERERRDRDRDREKEREMETERKRVASEGNIRTEARIEDSATKEQLGHIAHNQDRWSEKHSQGAAQKLHKEDQVRLADESHASRYGHAVLNVLFVASLLLCLWQYLQ